MRKTMDFICTYEKGDRLLLLILNDRIVITDGDDAKYQQWIQAGECYKGKLLSVAEVEVIRNDVVMGDFCDKCDKLADSAGLQEYEGDMLCDYCRIQLKYHR